jgi:uncharacterized membrane protein (UPF0127 family)
MPRGKRIAYEVYAVGALVVFVLLFVFAWYTRPTGRAAGTQVSGAGAAVAIPASLEIEPTRTIQLEGQTISVFVADTPTLEERGLGGRESLSSGQGMLFIFPTDGEYAFWMKDMRFSIDIVWLSADGSVVYMAQNVSPATYPQTFTPYKPARYVLELPAGWAKEYTVSLGDKARL